jgi:hypothetical protein
MFAHISDGVAVRFEAGQSQHAEWRKLDRTGEYTRLTGRIH